MSSVNKTPFLNDIHLFNLDNRTWYQVKYTEGSERMDYMGNHCLAVFSDGDNYERIVLYGGLYNIPHKNVSEVKSFLSNQTLIMTTWKTRKGAIGEQDSSPR